MPGSMGVMASTPPFEQMREAFALPHPSVSPRPALPSQAWPGRAKPRLPGHALPRQAKPCLAAPAQPRQACQAWPSPAVPTPRLAAPRPAVPSRACLARTGLASPWRATSRRACLAPPCLSSRCHPHRVPNANHALQHFLQLACDAGMFRIEHGSNTAGPLDRSFDPF